MKNLSILCASLLLTIGCVSNQTKDMTNISKASISEAYTTISEANSDINSALLKTGIEQTAFLWRAEDGSESDFVLFCQENYISSSDAREILFDKLSTAYEILFGTSNQTSVSLKLPITLTGEEPTKIDYILGAYSPGAHFSDDMYATKVAFITTLNFPNYTLSQKNQLGKEWSRLEWGYARMGDIFTARVPASIKQESSVINSRSDNYIADYNIIMGNLLTEEGETLFPKDMILLSHWNLRDEIKSNYADVPNAFKKQQMIYKVMEHIIDQTIPKEVINNTEYNWAPYSNKTYKDSKEVTLEPEGTERYSHILETFKMQQKLDDYYPQLPTGILRNFEGGMEISDKEIEELFVNLISSPQVKQVGALIKSRLGRDLQPYDIWYNGFKEKPAISEDELSDKTRKKYPNAKAFEKDIPNMLRNIGFNRSDANYLSDKIVVEPARGSGHAWGASGRWQPSRLRTRIGEKGMDYKGYNIAVHELGHNVEQTLSLYDVDHYMLNGVPNTAYTEALAFIFQKRDLQLLGYAPKGNKKAGLDPNTTLAIFWEAYEIMGVSLVDMFSWRWLYENPTATVSQLKDAVIRISKEVWNKYYEPVLGTPNSPILAVYSHMISSPMYLPNYPFGHVIEFQLEEYFANAMLKQNKDFAQEIKRIFTLGCLTPQAWMQEAVGSNVSTDPLINAVEECLKNL